MCRLSTKEQGNFLLKPLFFTDREFVSDARNTVSNLTISNSNLSNLSLGNLILGNLPFVIYSLEEVKH